ncbi:hypothetical protein [Chitinophaga caseinilytica]|uniref:hypothetical protein n=1 Tax=Chitinophaga caseinilytica TaxID=2267521 RepID=UPI003C2D0470
MNATSLMLACLLAAGLLFSGCRKHAPFPDCEDECRITKVKGDLGSPMVLDSLMITYNSKGNPVSMVRSVVGTSAPNWLFRYDQKGRMTDFYGIYSHPTSFDTWHRYYYDTKNRIVLDSTYEFGEVSPDYKPIPSPGRPYLGVRNISTYQYDNHNRIIRSTDTYGRDTVFVVRQYRYNSAGNLAEIVEQWGSEAPNSITFSYDDKKNYHRLHVIWQFLDRDFSMNNSLPVTTYNRFGLPVSIQLSAHRHGYFATEFFTYAEFEYSCK